MGSLDQDRTDTGDVDKQLQQAVPWVSDPQNRQQRDDETRRLEEEVIKAARRLERESASLPTHLTEPQTAVGFSLLEPWPQLDRARSEDRARRVLAQLRPEFMTPPDDRFAMLSPGKAMAAGFFGAMAVSAMVALVVVGITHRPTIGGDVSIEQRAVKGDSLAATTLGDLARVSDAQAKMTPTDEPSEPAETVLAAAPPNDIAAPNSTAAIVPPPAMPQANQPETAKQVIAAAPANPVAAASAAPAARPARSLAPDEIASLRKRGRDLFVAGDIASARLALTRVAEAGDAEASFLLAGTFDPTVLSNLGVVGIDGDSANARLWYARAAELGSQEARQRLQALR